MANEKVVLRRGPSSSIPSTKVPGTILIETDTGRAYVDDTESSRIQIKDDTKLPIDGTAKKAESDSNGNSLTDRITTLDTNESTGVVTLKNEKGETKGTVVNSSYVDTALSDKMDKVNPTGTGSFSLNRRAGTSIGGWSFAEGSETTASGEISHAEGYDTTASGDYSHSEGTSTTALGDSSHSEGRDTTAGQMGFKVTACEKLTDTTGTYTLTSVTGLAINQSYSVHLSSSKEDCGYITAIDTTSKKITVDGYPDIALSSSSSSTANYITIVNEPTLGDILVSGHYSHAEGLKTTASGVASHAEGRGTTASGGLSHAEGRGVIASGSYSHAEGSYTTASGDYSHAEGDGTNASGMASHAEGSFTTASSDYQHVQGTYNIEDSSNNYADIIGNGNGTARSNAATVDWSGNAWYAGDVYVGSTSGTNKDSGSKKLATEEYVNSAVISGGSNIVIDDGSID